jgi:hypothetical protein
VAVPVSWINNCQFISCTIKTLNMSQGPFWHTPLSPWIKCVVRCQSNVCQEESEKWYKFYSSGQDFFRTHLCCVSPWKYNGVSSALSACCRLAVQLTHQTDWLADMTQRDCLYILTDWLTDWLTGVRGMKRQKLKKKYIKKFYNICSLLNIVRMIRWRLM